MRGKNVLKNTIFELLNQFVIIIRGLIIPRLIISVYGSNINGLTSSITSFLAYIIIFDAGFNVVIKSQLYFPIINNDKKQIEKILYSSKRFFQRIAGIFIVYIMLLSIIYPRIISDFDWKFIDLLIIVISMSTFFEYYFGITHRIFLEASGKSYLISIINVLVTSVSTIVIAILIKNNFDITIIKLVGSLIFIIKPLLLRYYVIHKYQINISKSYENEVIKNKWDGLAQHIAWVVYTNTDVAVLTLFSTLTNVSVYLVYSLVCISLRSITGAITSGIDATFGNIIANKNIKELNYKFNYYEIIYFSIITILFSCSIVLIIPFVKVYTLGISDINYINIPFGILLVLGEYIIALRRPYRALIHAKGHFKETRIGAWVECIVNITLSIILVFKYGLVGIAIGSLIGAFIRTIEFIYHANKMILNRKVIESVKHIVLVIVETSLIIIISRFLPFIQNISYFNLIINGLMVLLVSTLIVFFLNAIYYRKLKIINLIFHNML